ncbi:hypothetical protein M0802_001474 [Mischocyttarus mexicanus]|nr:hypothetical protein M0802_001474 [Mischocyttarus mexicanus]
MKLTLQLLLTSLLISLTLQKRLYSWKYVDYDWIDESQKEYYEKYGLYVKNIVPIIDALIANDRVFVTQPRYPGVPASIGTLNTKKISGGGPVVKPYPDWGWADIRRNCNETIISVYRIELDDCGRLWVLDCGLNGEVRVCPQKLIAFDIKTDKILLQKEIPNKYGSNVNGTGALVTPLVITSGKQCQQTTVYMADIEGYALVIWWGGDHFSRFESPVFASDPETSYFKIGNESMTLSDGLAGLAYAPAGPYSRYNKLYFSALTSYNLYHVSVNNLKRSNNSEDLDIIQDKGDINYHKLPLVIKGPYMYFSTIEDFALRKWDIRTSFTKKNAKIIKQDKELLNFVSGLKILKIGTPQCTLIYGLSNKYQKTETNTRSNDEINYNIFMYNLCNNTKKYDY